MARQATVQRAARQSERLRGATHVAVVARQRFLNEHLLNIFERKILDPRRGARAGSKTEIGGAYLLPRREQHGALHDVIELANVARPRMRQQRLHRAGVEAGEWLAIARGVPPEKMH